MGVAFEELDVESNLFPVISGDGGVSLTVNFGDQPMKYHPPDESYQTVWEVTRKEQ